MNLNIIQKGQKVKYFIKINTLQLNTYKYTEHLTILNTIQNM